MSKVSWEKFKKIVGGDLWEHFIRKMHDVDPRVLPPRVVRTYAAGLSVAKAMIDEEDHDFSSRVGLCSVYDCRTCPARGDKDVICGIPPDRKEAITFLMDIYRGLYQIAPERFK